MANENTKTLNWVKKYKVRAVDMNDFESAMVSLPRAQAEGSLGAAVLRGLDVSIQSGTNLLVQAGIAQAASGYVMVKNSVVTVDGSAATAGSLPKKSLLVAAPLLTDSDFTPSPTDPLSTFALKTEQGVQFYVVEGTASATPQYPAKGANEVILAGIKSPPGAVSFDVSMLDFEVRESIGANSLIGKNQSHYDDRLMPYRSTNKVMGIKPAQSIGSKPSGMTYAGQLQPSRYPLSASAFNPVDATVNFETGVIAGGDTTSGMFTPTIPAVNNSVVALVTLTNMDVLAIFYGNEGGYSQCLAGIQNQNQTGPGAVPLSGGNFPLAYVIITSYAGAISDIQVLDARALLGIGTTAAKSVQERPTGTIDGSNNIFTLSKVPSDPNSLLLMLDSTPLVIDEDYELALNQITITNPDFIPSKGQAFYSQYLVYGNVPNSGSGGLQAAQFTQETPAGVINGVNNVFTLANAPTDPMSIFFWVDNNPLTGDQYTVTGQVITITDAEMIPSPGQTVFAKYLYLGVISGGGGASGNPGWQTYGSLGSPILFAGTAPLAVAAVQRQMRFVASNGGSVTAAGVPQIAPGTIVGQELMLVGVSDINFPNFDDGNGLIANGLVRLTSKQSWSAFWDGAVWREVSRPY